MKVNICLLRHCYQRSSLQRANERKHEVLEVKIATSSGHPSSGQQTLERFQFQLQKGPKANRDYQTVSFILEIHTEIESN